MSRVLRTAATHRYDYSSFDQLNGTHPWQTAVPEGCILYPVRQLPGGKVSYFNFELAKEMGLIDSRHSHRLNKKLEQKLLDTFCIRIINEWDQAHNVVVPKAMIKPNLYMATRYLQLQHPDKSGRTSGDGRCIWNGIVSAKGRIWDVSSRGTGVTQLAPGVVLAGKPLQSGNQDHGYGCGLAEIDELYAAALMAEIFHRNGISTERVLCIIDLGKGIGIGVRAGLNLMRPAHMFSHLKQGELEPLHRAADYLVDRQHKNGQWSFSTSNRKRYELMLEEIASNFARFAAHLDREYIFAWLDWDGDNVLIDGGIIDYGSVRQFGLRHDQYRYDDVDRFSTNLNGQRQKARQIVKTFSQLVDFITTGERKPLPSFKNCKAVRIFDLQFKHHLLDRFLYQLGFNQAQRADLLNSNHRFVQQLYDSFSYFERIKTYRKMQRVADGVNRPAIFNMRAIAAHLPGFFHAHIDSFPEVLMPESEFFSLMVSSHATRKDKRMNDRLTNRIVRFQRQYKSLILKARGKKDLKDHLEKIALRASRINREDRITGNALIHVVDELLKARRKGCPDSVIQEVMAAFIEDQTLDPEMKMIETSTPSATAPQELLMTVLTLVQGHKEEI